MTHFYQKQLSFSSLPPLKMAVLELAERNSGMAEAGCFFF